MMSEQNLELACDRLSHVVDAMQFERLRWERDEGPMLAKLVTLSRGALEQRRDFELTEEGSTPDSKGFVLKVHSNRVIGIKMQLHQRQAIITAFPIERSRYRLREGQPIVAVFEDVTEEWMSMALQQIFVRIAPITD